MHLRTLRILYALHLVRQKRRKPRRHHRHLRALLAPLAVGLMLTASTMTAAASPTLQQGSHGHEVMLLQQKLDSIGYSKEGLIH